jgi:hypothetical protein
MAERVSLRADGQPSMYGLNYLGRAVIHHSSITRCLSLLIAAQRALCISPVHVMFRCLAIRGDTSIYHLPKLRTRVRFPSPAPPAQRHHRLTRSAQQSVLGNGQAPARKLPATFKPCRGAAFRTVPKWCMTHRRVTS